MCSVADSISNLTEDAHEFISLPIEIFGFSGLKLFFAVDCLCFHTFGWWFIAQYLMKLSLTQFFAWDFFIWDRVRSKNNGNSKI